MALRGADRSKMQICILITFGKFAGSSFSFSGGERFEVALMLKDALMEKGREKMSDGGGDKKSEVAKSGLSINNKPEKPEPTKEEPKHDTRQEIADNLGWSTGKVAQAEIVRREAPQGDRFISN